MLGDALKFNSAADSVNLLIPWQRRAVFSAHARGPLLSPLQKDHIVNPRYC